MGGVVSWRPRPSETQGVPPAWWYRLTDLGGRVQDHAKKNGVHYTPPELAAFLADAMVKTLGPQTGALHILDPACGEGSLLFAFAQALPARARGRLTLEGYETDAAALAGAQRL